MSATAISPVKLRLTRRGRLVFSFLGAIVIGAALSVAAVVGSTQASASVASEPADFGYVIVQPGASLWQIASAVDSSVDPRDLVAEIVRLNQLQGSDVEAGQPLALPLRYSDAPGVISAEALGLER